MVGGYFLLQPAEKIRKMGSKSSYFYELCAGVFIFSVKPFGGSNKLWKTNCIIYQAILVFRYMNDGLPLLPNCIFYLLINIY